MNRTEALKERINFYTEILKLISTFAFVTAGGTIGLFFRLDKKIAPFFIIFGIVLIVGFVSGALQLFGITSKI